MSDELERLSAFQSQLVLAALAAFTEEHRELTSVWSGLDTKAQGTAAVSGIFLAGAFGFARDLTDLSGLERVLLVLTVVGLVTGVFLALLALRIRNVSAAPAGQQVQSMVDNLIEVSDPTLLAETLLAFHSDRSKLWHAAILDLRSEVDAKGKLVWRSQMVLTAAIALAAALVILMVVA